MNTAALDALERSLPALRRYALLAVLMWLMAGGAAAALSFHTWAGVAHKADPVTWSAVWVSIFSAGSATLGLAAMLLWIGGVIEPSVARMLWLPVAGGAALVVANDVRPDFGAANLPSDVVMLVLFPLGLVVAAEAVQRARQGPQQCPVWARAFGWLSLLFYALFKATHEGLALTTMLYPVTWDAYVYGLDARIAPGAAAAVFSAAEHFPVLGAFLFACYDVLPIMVAVVLGLAVRAARTDDLNLWRFQVMPYAVAWLVYAVVPVCGPVYAFAQQGFPDHAPLASTWPMQLMKVDGFRNGMPSMHLATALFIFIIAQISSGRVAIGLSAAFCVATAAATLGTGGHYVIDLVVALPFAAVLAVALVGPQLFVRRHTAAWLWACAALSAAWLLLIRYTPVWLADRPWLLRGACLMSIISAVLAMRRSTLALRKASPDRPAHTAVPMLGECIPAGVTAGVSSRS